MSTGNSDELMKEGVRLFKSKEYKESAEIFSKIVQLDENNHKAWNALGVTNSKIGDEKLAYICFKKAITLEPNNPIYRKNIKRINSLEKPISANKENQYKLKISFANLFLLIFGIGIMALIISVVASYVIDLEPTHQMRSTSISKSSPNITIPTNENNITTVVPTVSTATIFENKSINPSNIQPVPQNKTEKYLYTVTITPTAISTNADLEKEKDDDTLKMYVYNYIPNIVNNVESIIQEVNPDKYESVYQIDYEERPYFQDKYELLKNNITKLREKITPLKTSSQVSKDKEIILEGLDHLFDSGAMIEKGLLITTGQLMSDDRSRGPVLTKDGINAGNIGVKMLREKYSMIFNGESIPELPKDKDIYGNSYQNPEYSYQSDTCNDYYGCPYCCKCDGLLERAKMAEDYELFAYKSAYDDCISKMRYVSNLESQRSRIY